MIELTFIYLLKKALNGCDGIFHLAAFKDVILAKEHPLKAVQTNILGTLNLLKVSSINSIYPLVSDSRTL